MPLGATLAPPSVLANVMAGKVVTGVVSFALAVVVPSPTLALLVSWVVPARTGVTTVTANVLLPDAPPATMPSVSVQGVPAALPSAQLQPTLLAAALNVVFAGTASVSVTPARLILPVLA